MNGDERGLPRTTGAAFEAGHPARQGQVGQATTRLMKQRPLVNFAVEWMERSREQPCAAP